MISIRGYLDDLTSISVTGLWWELVLFNWCGTFVGVACGSETLQKLWLAVIWLWHAVMTRWNSMWRHLWILKLRVSTFRFGRNWPGQWMRFASGLEESRAPNVGMCWSFAYTIWSVEGETELAKFVWTDDTLEELRWPKTGLVETVWQSEMGFWVGTSEKAVFNVFQLFSFRLLNFYNLAVSRFGSLVKLWWICL